MNVSKEELLHIADLSDLIIEENEVDEYLKNLQEILEFANAINSVQTDNLDITIGANEAKNVFRKDEIKEFDNIEGLLQNAPSLEQHMFKIPKVVQ